jgi:hypothetical protein
MYFNAFGGWRLCTGVRIQWTAQLVIFPMSLWQMRISNSSNRHFYHYPKSTFIATDIQIWPPRVTSGHAIQPISDQLSIHSNSGYTCKCANLARMYSLQASRFFRLVEAIVSNNFPGNLILGQGHEV